MVFIALSTYLENVLARIVEARIFELKGLQENCIDLQTPWEIQDISA